MSGKIFPVPLSIVEENAFPALIWDHEVNPGLALITPVTAYVLLSNNSTGSFMTIPRYGLDGKFHFQKVIFVLVFILSQFSGIIFPITISLVLKYVFFLESVQISSSWD